MAGTGRQGAAREDPVMTIQDTTRLNVIPSPILAILGNSSAGRVSCKPLPSCVRLCRWCCFLDPKQECLVSSRGNVQQRTCLSIFNHLKHTGKSVLSWYENTSPSTCYEKEVLRTLHTRCEVPALKWPICKSTRKCNMHPPPFWAPG